MVFTVKVVFVPFIRHFVA